MNDPNVPLRHAFLPEYRARNAVEFTRFRIHAVACHIAVPLEIRGRFRRHGHIHRIARQLGWQSARCGNVARILVGCGRHR
ncbi:hypothetical protein SDC9_159894 [bioreactor metagenome]|uniref:Uncharacterized protein n=1 Tax=bioreactor metagenome TaxID=1076179 RepID=A0A645FG40_9ZZZZ